MDVELSPKADNVVLVNDTLTVETDLTEEEKEIIANGRKEYKSGTFVNFNDIM